MSIQPFRYAQLILRGAEYETFCLLSDNANPEAVNANMLQVLNDATVGAWKEQGFFYPQLKRLADIHLHSE